MRSACTLRKHYPNAIHSIATCHQIHSIATYSCTDDLRSPRQWLSDWQQVWYVVKNKTKQLPCKNAPLESFICTFLSPEVTAAICTCGHSGRSGANGYDASSPWKISQLCTNTHLSCILFFKEVSHRHPGTEAEVLTTDMRHSVSAQVLGEQITRR